MSIYFQFPPKEEYPFNGTFLDAAIYGAPHERVNAVAFEEKVVPKSHHSNLK